MTFAEFKAEYDILAAEAGRCFLAWKKTRRLCLLGYVNDLESSEAIAKSKAATAKKYELLSSVGICSFDGGDGEDLTSDVLEWVEMLLMALESRKKLRK